MKKIDLRTFSNKDYSYYHTNIPLDYLQTQIDRYKKEFSLDFDPEYQRDYIWTLEQKTKYMEYLIRNGRDQSVSGKNIYFNHPNWMDSFEGKMEVVDGKQRLEAILGWLNNEYSIFDNVYRKDVEDFTLRFIDLSFYIAKFKNRVELVNWYIGMNNGGTVHTEKDIQRAIDYRNSLLEKENTERRKNVNR